jgi:ligand-binding sensor domain-containing protein/signal transduction histidine kinase
VKNFTLITPDEMFSVLPNALPMPILLFFSSCLRLIVCTVFLFTASVLLRPSAIFLHAQSLPTASRVYSSSPDRLLSQYFFENWQITDGLPQNTVQSIVRTRDGYLWLGTVEGAARFDGVSFEIFSKETFPILTNNDINVIFEASNGALWLGAEDGSIYRRASSTRNAKWERFDKTSGLPGNSIWKIYEDRIGTLWISTIGGGLVQFKNGAFTTLNKAHGLQSNDIGKCFEDTDGTLWFGTFGGGLHTLREGKIISVFTKEHGLPSNSVYDVLRDKNGTLWAGTEGGLVQMANDGQVSQQSSQQSSNKTPNKAQTLFIPINHTTLKTSFIWTLLDDKHGTMWVGSALGLWRYDGAQRVVIDSLSAVNGALPGALPSNDIYSLTSDHEGSLWLGTIGGGLCRLKTTKFIGISAKEGLQTGFVWCGSELSNGNMWLGTNNVGLVEVRNNRATPITTIDKLLATQKIYGMHIGASGTIYLASWGSGLLTCAANNTFQRQYTTKDGLASNNLWTVLEDRTGAVWIGMGSGGLQRLKNSAFTTFTTSQGLAGVIVRRLAEDPQGNIWVGTLNGVNVVRGDSIIATYSTKNGLLSNSIRCIMNDSSGGMWIGTPAGLHLIKNGAISTITKQQGLFNDGVSAVLDDGNGQYWMSCNYGIFSVEKQAVHNVLEKRASRVKSTVYGIDDGMPSAECNAGNPGAWKLRDGRLAFATTKGVAIINPRSLVRDTIPPPVVIERVMVDSLQQQIAQDSSLNNYQETSIDATLGRLRFYYTALSLAFPKRVKFKVRLEGYDNDWVDVGTRRDFSYTNLPRGRTYRFAVIACNSDGVWSARPAILEIYLKPFFYETWWFTGLSICAVLGAGLGIFRLRTLQLKRRAEELERLVEERTTELQATNTLLLTANSQVQEQMRLVGQQSEEITQTNIRLLGTNNELERTNAALIQANLFKTTMLSMASHDLKNPLASILALTEVLIGKTDDSYVREMLNIVVSSAERMFQLIVDLLDTSALEMGRMELHKAIMNATLIIDSVVEQYLAAAEKKSQTLLWVSDSQ